MGGLTLHDTSMGGSENRSRRSIGRRGRNRAPLMDRLDPTGTIEAQGEEGAEDHRHENQRRDDQESGVGGRWRSWIIRFVHASLMPRLRTIEKCGGGSSPLPSCNGNASIPPPTGSGWDGASHPNRRWSATSAACSSPPPVYRSLVADWSSIRITTTVVDSAACPNSGSIAAEHAQSHAPMRVWTRAHLVGGRSPRRAR